MHNQRIRAVAALITLGAMCLVSFALATPAGAAVPGQIVITEWMYNPVASASEFVEVTNIGGEPVNMAGYSFDDDSRAAGTVSLAALGTLAPGASGLIVENLAAAFRTEWGVDATVKIVELNATNLGRNDEINIFSGATLDTLADRLTYGDQTFAGTIRTQGTSGVPTTCLPLGANNVGGWVFSAVGDGRGSLASVSGDIGSPGTTPLGACGPVTIVGGNGTGNPNTLPCQPEPASGTGPVAVGAQTWPGGPSVTVADQTCAWKTATGPEGRDMSGLVFDPTNAGVLYAVKNKSWVFRLVKQNGVWVPDTTNGWAAGKQIFFPGGVGQPDSEGLTIGADGALYVTTERDNAANTIALNSVLRFDPTATGTTLTPTTQWNLTADFPELNPPNTGTANLGFEGVTFVPDTYLVLNGFVDQSTLSTYYPSDYPGHGAGLFFAALENDGKLYAYALNADGTAHRVAVVDTGMGHVMDVQFDTDLQRIWALCDNTCSVSSTLLKVDATGTIVPDVVYARPAGLPNVNIEGFAITPDSTCVDGVKEAIWSDDGLSGVGHEGHALYSGTFPCGLDLGEQGVVPVRFVAGNSRAANPNNRITATVGAEGVAARETLNVSVATGTFAGAVGCSDTKGNSYSVVADRNTGNGRLFVCSAKLVTGLSAGDVVTATYPGFSGLSVVSVTAFSIASTGVTDGVSTSSGSNPAVNSGNITTTQAADVLFGVAAHSSPSTFSPGSGYTVVGEVSGGSGAGQRTVSPMFKVVSSTGVYSATGSLSGSGFWQAAVIAYQTP